MRETRVVVVGAGIGGLVAALLLAARGVQVTLVEAQASPGGKMRRQVVDGRPIDGGPTVFTMRWVFDEIMALAGGLSRCGLTDEEVERIWWESGEAHDSSSAFRQEFFVVGREQ